MNEERLPPYEELETAVGSLLLPAGDGVVTRWIREHGTWEPAESAVLTALIPPGAHVIDIGAHVGYMTLLAAARAGADGAVIAVEANPENARLLEENVARHGSGNVRVYEGAAWRTSRDTLTMTISPDNSGDHRVYRRDEALETVEVRSVALDDIVPEQWHVDLVKIDVQGTDHVALEGMRRIVERDKPTILVEFWPTGIEEFRDDPPDVVALYRRLGYQISMLEQPALPRDAAPETITEMARNTPTGFCTLLLQPGPSVAGPSVGQAVESLLARGPTPGPRSALGRLGPVARVVALRMMKPFTVYQRTVDAEIVREVRDLSRRIDELERRDE